MDINEIRLKLKKYVERMKKEKDNNNIKEAATQVRYIVEDIAAAYLTKIQDALDHPTLEEKIDIIAKNGFFTSEERKNMHILRKISNAGVHGDTENILPSFEEYFDAYCRQIQALIDKVSADFGARESLKKSAIASFLDSILYSIDYSFEVNNNNDVICSFAEDGDYVLIGKIFVDLTDKEAVSEAHLSYRNIKALDYVDGKYSGYLTEDSAARKNMISFYRNFETVEDMPDEYFLKKYLNDSHKAFNIINAAVLNKIADYSFSYNNENRTVNENGEVVEYEGIPKRTKDIYRITNLQRFARLVDRYVLMYGRKIPEYDVTKESGQNLYSADSYAVKGLKYCYEYAGNDKQKFFVYYNDALVGNYSADTTSGRTLLHEGEIVPYSVMIDYKKLAKDFLIKGITDDETALTKGAENTVSEIKGLAEYALQNTNKVKAAKEEQINKEKAERAMQQMERNKLRIRAGKGLKVFRALYLLFPVICLIAGMHFSQKNSYNPSEQVLNESGQLDMYAVHQFVFEGPSRQTPEPVKENDASSTFTIVCVTLEAIFIIGAVISRERSSYI